MCCRFQQWVDFCHDKSFENIVGRVHRIVCEDHFTPEDFIGNRLRPTAIPKLRGPPPIAEEVMQVPLATGEDQPAETTNQQVPSTSTPVSYTHLDVYKRQEL